MKKIFLVLFSFLMNCSSKPSTSNLPTSFIQRNTIKEQVVLERIKILGEVSSVNNKKALEENLTIHLKNYLEQGKYFEKGFLFTEKNLVVSEYKSFQFHFDKYEIKRKIDKSSIPWAFITLSLYFLFGGTIDIDEVQMSGGLEVSDFSNRKIFSGTSEIFEEREINIYSDEVHFPNSASARGKFFNELISDYKNRKLKWKKFCFIYFKVSHFFGNFTSA